MPDPPQTIVEVEKEEPSTPQVKPLQAKSTGLITAVYAGSGKGLLVSASDNNADKIKNLIRDRILKNRLAPGAGNTSLTTPVLNMTQSQQEKIVEPEVKLEIQLPPSRSSKPLK